MQAYPDPPAAVEGTLAELRARLERRQARIAVLGLGNVGLPLALAFHRAGSVVLGFDTDLEKLARLERGESPLAHLDADALRGLARSGRFVALREPERLAEADALVLCVPTPLDVERRPDLTQVVDATRRVAATLRPGQLVVLESTTWPGTTREVVAPLLAARGLERGRDYALAYSPERVDPGRPEHELARVPKLVGALDERSLAVASALYAAAGIPVQPVPSAEVAEAAKLLENTFRAVNIALVNELKLCFEALGIDVWEVIEAAATKPFGFMKFTPGPGLGGHCIPVAPHYLAWAARRAGTCARLVELSAEIDRSMPEQVVERVAAVLAARGRALEGARILLLGLAYKAGVDATHESPALRLLELLTERGAQVSYSDPWVPKAPASHAALLENPFSLALDEAEVARFDLLLFATDHAEHDHALLARAARAVVDTRNALGALMRGDPRYHRA